MRSAGWACRPLLLRRTAENKDDGRDVALTVMKRHRGSAEKQLYSDALLGLCIQHAKYYHQQFYLPVLRAIWISKVFKHWGEKKQVCLQHADPVLLALLEARAQKRCRKKGCAKGKQFCHRTVTRACLAYPLGTGACQQDGCSYYHNTGNNSHRGKCERALVSSSAPVRGEEGERCCCGGIPLAAAHFWGFCILGRRLGKPIFAILMFPSAV